MTYKALRNKAFRDSYAIVKATYKGEEWSGTPFVMVKGDYVSDYKPLESQNNFREGVKLESILDAPKDYTKAREIADYTEDSSDRKLIEVIGSTRTIYLQKQFYDFVKAIYPESEERVAGEFDNKFSPVKFYDKHKLVAVVMPINI